MYTTKTTVYLEDSDFELACRVTVLVYRYGRRHYKGFDLPDAVRFLAGVCRHWDACERAQELWNDDCAEEAQHHWQLACALSELEDQQPLGRIDISWEMGSRVYRELVTDIA